MSGIWRNIRWMGQQFDQFGRRCNPVRCLGGKALFSSLNEVIFDVELALLFGIIDPCDHFALFMVISENHTLWIPKHRGHHLSFTVLIFFGHRVQSVFWCPIRLKFYVLKNLLYDNKCLLWYSTIAVRWSTCRTAIVASCQMMLIYSFGT